MHESIFVDLFVVFLLARLAGEVFARLRQPPVVGELLVGMVIGGHALGLVQESEVLRAIAEVGVVFLLFEVGLENRFSDMRRVGGVASAVAISGVVVPFGLGFGLMQMLGRPTPESLFVGAALVATSVGVTARVIGELGLVRERESQVILGAAVIDDVLGLLILAVVAGATGEGFSLRALVVLLVEVALFLVITATLGTRLVRRLGPTLKHIRLVEGPFVVGVTVCLGLAALADRIGLAAIVGAFLAGMVFAEMRDDYDMVARIQPVTHFLTPFFFVLTGMAVDPAFFSDPSVLAIGAAVVGLAVVGKLVPCGLAAARFGRLGATIVGVGMIPRAEVGIIVASIGLAAGIVAPDVYGVVVSMSILTTILPPPILRHLFLRKVARGQAWEAATP